jgi:hypothetical protein
VKAAPGAAGSGVVAAETVVPGGNLAAAVSYGDLTLAGVGTVTSVCNGEVVGFGHPMLFTGKSSMGLSPASAIYVHSDNVSPGFKVANVGAPVGTITDDRLTGISGDLGTAPDATDVRTSVTFGARSNALDSDAFVKQWNADVTFSQALANHDRVVDGIMPGSEVTTYRATGTNAAGSPFEVAFVDRYQSSYDISFEGIWEAADATWVLSGMQGVTVDTLEVDSVVEEDSSVWQLRKLEAKRGNKWVKVSRRNPVRATAGRTLRLRVSLESGTETVQRRLSIAVPRKARGSEGYLSVTGGNSIWTDGVWNAQTPEDLSEAFASAPRNDEIQVSMEFYQRRSSFRRTEVSEPQSHVVQGRRSGMVIVR